MMTKYLNNKGLTMIELMLAIVIAGIISSAIGGFLVVHIKSYEIAQDVVDVQYEAQMALNGMSEIIMESRGLYEIESQTGTSYTAGDLLQVGSPNNDGYVEDVRVLAFQGLEDGGLPVYHVFIKEADSTELMYYNTTNAAILNDIGRATMYARNIQALSVVAGQGTHSAGINNGIAHFDESDAIEVIITLERGESRAMTLRSIAKYRNILPD